jgi:hypothetical protein
VAIAYIEPKFKLIKNLVERLEWLETTIAINPEIYPNKIHNQLGKFDSKNPRILLLG